MAGLPVPALEELEDLKDQAIIARSVARTRETQLLRANKDLVARIVELEKQHKKDQLQKANLKFLLRVVKWASPFLTAALLFLGKMGWAFLHERVVQWDECAQYVTEQRGQPPASGEAK